MCLPALLTNTEPPLPPPPDMERASPRLSFFTCATPSLGERGPP